MKIRCSYNTAFRKFQVITVLNHAGVCVSYVTAWKYLKKLTAESRYLEVVREGHWIWAYDNLNFNLRVCHEREGTQSLIGFVGSGIRVVLIILCTSAHFTLGGVMLSTVQTVLRRKIQYHPSWILDN